MATNPVGADSASINSPTAPLLQLDSSATPIDRILSRFDRATLESFVSVAIDLLDLVDGDAEAEDGDEDCCSAHDDRAGCDLTGMTCDHYGPGDLDDAEDDDPAGDESDREEEEPLIPVYGLDQRHMLSWTYGPAPVTDFPCCETVRSDGDRRLR